jgi:hypothetical protein
LFNVLGYAWKNEADPGIDLRCIRLWGTTRTSKGQESKLSAWADERWGDTVVWTENMGAGYARCREVDLLPTHHWPSVAGSALSCDRIVRPHPVVQDHDFKQGSIKNKVLQLNSFAQFISFVCF